MGNPKTQKAVFSIAAAIVFFVLCWKNLYLSGWVPVDGNVIRAVYPRWALFQAALKLPGLLLWNPFYNMGEPFLADPQSLAAYPVSWLLAPFSNFLHYFQAWVALHTALAAAAIGGWLWRQTRDGWAAAAAALLFAFNGFFTA